MKHILDRLVGKKIDVNCGTSAIFRGELEGFENDVLTLKDENGKIYYLDAGQIIAVSEVTDPATRPGFIA